MAGLLLLVYLLLWSPVRRGIVVHGVYPVLNAAATEGEATVTLNTAAGVVRIDVARKKTSSMHSGRDLPEFWRGTLAAPAGVKFLLPALFLVVLAPGRPYWLYFGAGHLVLGGLALGSGVVLLHAPTYGEPLLRFVQSYATDAYSLGVPALVLIAHRSGHSSLEREPAPDARFDTS